MALVSPRRRVTVRRSGGLAAVPRWCWLALIAIGMIGAAQIIAAGRPGERAPSFSGQCDEWDRAATAAFITLLAERDPLIEQQLGDAVFRLRRARKYCRHDLVDLARLDYQTLTGGRYRHLR